MLGHVFPPPRLVMPLLVASALVGCGSTSKTETSVDAIPASSTSAATTPATPAATKAGAPRLKQVGTFRSPVYVAGAPGDTRRVFVVEQGGAIRVIRAGAVLSKPFLDIRSRVLAGGEQGLLSVAFAPDYASSGRFYVYFTEKSGKQAVWQFRRATADTANAGSGKLVLRMDDPEGNHNGGQLQFGPDKLLYIGTGDGGGADDQHGARGNGQNLGSFLGKILRIDPKAGGGYTVPPSNPFAGRSGARGEIYAYGLRNPWRFSFDRSTDDLTIGDVGQGAIEEVDFVRSGGGKGANFGWRPYEGTQRHSPGESAPGHVPPVIQKSHSDGWCSITGGYVVRDPQLPALRGRYVYGDFCMGRLRAAKLSAGRATGDKQLALRKVSNLSSFGEDTSGRVYVASLDGPVYRLTQ